MKKYYLLLMLWLFPLIGFSQMIYSMSWDTSLPIGDTRNISETYSARGITFFELRGFVAPKVSIGGYFSWHTMYEEETGTFSDGNLTASGRQKRYLNTFPIIVTSHYYFGEDDGSITPFIGLGVGAASAENRTDMGLFSVTDNNWHFAMVPEVGLLFPLRGDASVIFKAKFNQFFEARNAGPYQYFNFSLGFAWY